MKNSKSPLLLIALIAFILIFTFRQPLAILWNWMGNREAVIAYVQELGVWGPALLFVLLVVQVFLAIIPGQTLMVACGYLYGFWGGLFITWTSLVGGGYAAFALARRYGRPFAERWVTPETLSRWDKAAHGQGIFFFAMSLVLPVFPNDAMCYVAGLGKISPPRFLVANMIGRGMACLLASVVGAFGSQIPLWGWACGIGLILTGCVGWWLKKYFTSNNISALKGDSHVCIG
ncbi:MAG: TVP38/TMEM64 family protein [Chloroflexi bacterium]|nr:TVP38/TMEM64 family protein [Chloroflexota bacterium]